MWKNIASILSSNRQEWKTPKNMVIFAKIISIYPSKSEFYMASQRIIHYTEQNIISIEMILETMRSENEDEDPITAVDLLLKGKTDITGDTKITGTTTVIGNLIAKTGTDTEGHGQL